MERLGHDGQSFLLKQAHLRQPYGSSVYGRLQTQRTLQEQRI